MQVYNKNIIIVAIATIIKKCYTASITVRQI